MATEPVKLKLIPNGPLRIEEGEYQITLVDGTVIDKTAPF